MQVSLVILAAGQGTRMNSDLPKVLHKVAAAPLLHHAMAAGRALEPARTVVVVGHGAEEVARIDLGDMTATATGGTVINLATFHWLDLAGYAGPHTVTACAGR